MHYLPQRNGDMTRRALFQVALHMYNKHGYQATSLANIARDLGITSAAIYYHFGSKDELLVASLCANIESMIDAHARLHPDLDPTEDLWTFVALHVHLQLFPGYDGPYVFGAAQLLAQVKEEHRPPLRNVMRKYVDRLVEVLETGIATKAFMRLDPRPVAFAIFGMDHHINQWYRPGGKLSPTELANLYADMALRMVGTQPISQRAKLWRLVDESLSVTFSDKASQTSP